MFRLVRPTSLVLSSGFALGLSSSIHNEAAFTQKEFRPFRLVNAYELNYNTKIFRFALPTPDSETGMVSSGCILVEGVGRDGNLVSRPYTPVTGYHTKGHFDLLVKNYPNGNVSSYLHSLNIGDFVNVKGPFPKLKYAPNTYKHVGMIAGGTGLTPMLQVIQEILSNSEDKTQITFLFANTTEEDILLKDLLDTLQATHPNFRVIYTVSSPTENWKGEVGYINMQMIEKYLPAPGPESLILVCGPPSMMKAISGDKDNREQGELTGLLKERGFTKEHVFKF